jgi:hypothetical protein
MNIRSSISKVSRAFGKVTDVTSTTWKDAWTYVTAALDGIWGQTIFDDGIAVHSGYNTYWESNLIYATSNATQIIVPISCQNSYVVWINNITTQNVICKLIDPGINTIVFSTTIGNAYKVISSNFNSND